MAQPEEVSPTQKEQHLLSIYGQAHTPAGKHIDGGRAFHPIELTSECSFARADGTHVPGAQSGKFAAAERAAAIVEGSGGERITDPNVPIEVGQRRNLHWIGLVAFDYDRQPQS